MENIKTRKVDFLEGFYLTDKTHVRVSVKLPNCPVPEVIINPKNNFIEKHNYYKNAYDDGLRLKANPEIYIVDWEFFNLDD